MESEFREELTAAEAIVPNHTDYAKYSIREFLPSMYDTLKLVARRIIWTMGTKTEYQKCTSLVANTMNCLHPHGNASIEGAVIRLCQPFTQCLPLIHAAGNVGAIGNSARPSAPRYLDVCRSEFACDLFFTRVNTKTLTYVPNELNNGVEPASFLPIVPCLFLGNSGIGMGFKSEIPMYDFVDVCDLTIKYVQHRKDALFHPKNFYSEFAKYLVPAYPQYSLIRNFDQLQAAYSEGNFNVPIVLDGCMDVYPNRIHLRSIPYGQSFPQILDHLKQEKAKASFISAHVNEVSNLLAATDIGDVKITLTRATDVFDVLEQLKKELSYTKSITPIWNFSDNEGKVFNLTPFQLMEKWYVERYRSILGDLKITQRELNTQKREIEAKVIVVDHTDRVTDIVKTSSSKVEAVGRLVNAFKDQHLSPLQAEYILTLSLAQLTREGKDKLLADLEQVISKIKEHTEKFKDIDHIIIGDVEWIRNKYAPKIIRKCAPPDYVGCLHINGNGIVQVRGVQELAHQLGRWINENVSIEMYPSGKSIHVKYLDNKGYLEHPLCFPKAFKAHDMKTLKHTPHSTVILNDGQICRVETMARPSKGMYIPVGMAFSAITDKGVVELHNATDAPKRQQISATGVKTNIQYISPIVSDELIVAYYDNREVNELHIGKFKNGEKLILSILSKPVIAGIFRPGDPIALTIDDKFLNRCNTKHLYFKDAESLLGNEQHVVIYLNRRVTSNKKTLVQVIKGRELYGVQHLTKIKNIYEFI